MANGFPPDRESILVGFTQTFASCAFSESDAIFLHRGASNGLQHSFDSFC